MNRPAATRIAMWSGPRNISTAMLRSFGNRPDCFVSDEPLYAFYLDQTGLDHPGRAATLARHDRNWQSVIDGLTGEIPNGRTVWYQKHMAHHLLPQVDRSWLGKMQNAFLIRDPREMLTSLIEFLPSPRVEDTGLPQQVEIFNLIHDRDGSLPPVIDGRDVLENPEGILRALCDRLGISFYDAMLAWPAGKRETDGAWADEWYAKVYQTTSFAAYRPKTDEIPESLVPVYERCQQLYQTLADHRIRIPSTP
jgi:hypothetical protein